MWVVFLLSDFSERSPKPRSASAACPAPCQQWCCLPSHVTAGCGRTSFAFVCQAGTLGFLPGENYGNTFGAGSAGALPSPEHLALLLFGVCDFLPVSGFRYFGDSVMTFSEGLSEEGWRTNPVALCSPSARASSARGRGSAPVSSHRRLPARWKHIKVFGFTLASLAY